MNITIDIYDYYNAISTMNWVIRAAKQTVETLQNAVRRCCNCGTVMPEGDICPRCGYDNGIK